jgi:uncharacterized membrane protein YeiH
MLAALEVPDLASSTPLWLALLTIFVNAVVGALRGYTDTSRQWDIMGVTFFAVLMGLGGGFIRDALLGNLPATSLRDPWSMVAVLAGIVIVVVMGRHIVRLSPILDFLNALALGLFAVVGVAHARVADLPFINAVLIGTLSAVGGGMLVSVLQGQIPKVLLASTPHALLAVLGSITYATIAIWQSTVASFAGVGSVIIAQYLVDHFDVQTRPAGKSASSPIDDAD